MHVVKEEHGPEEETYSSGLQHVSFFVGSSNALESLGLEIAYDNANEIDFIIVVRS